VDYLLEEANRIVPGRRLGVHDIIATYAGARPLLAFAGSATKASREHRIEIDRWGLVSVLGGKFTTYRRIAQDTVDLIMRRLRWRGDRCLTDHVSLLDTIQPVIAERWQRMTRDLDPDLLARLLTRYGAGAFHVLSLIEQDRALAHPVCPHHEYIFAELLYAAHHEFACTITDILARRTRIAFSSCQGLDLLSPLTMLLQQHLPAPVPSLAHQVAEYHQFLARSLAFRHAGRTAALART
jgi:glycerol-3-phosphate dehydrogenase